MFGGGEQEFREGDRAWAGANVLELPDLSSVHLEARLDESDRGRLNPGQDAMVRIEAVPGKEFKARINKISLLARVDFSSGWPPPKNFDLGLVLLEVDPRIRPGMTAVARIATERMPDVVLVPSESVFQKDGSPGRLQARRFDVPRAAHADLPPRQGAGGGDVRRRARRPYRDAPSDRRTDQETAMKRRVIWGGLVVAAIGLAAAMTRWPSRDFPKDPAAYRRPGSSADR